MAISCPFNGMFVPIKWNKKKYKCIYNIVVLRLSYQYTWEYYQVLPYLLPLLGSTSTQWTIWVPNWFAQMDPKSQVITVLRKPKLNVFWETCLSSALGDPMREHMYCELKRRKPQSHDSAPLMFLSPTPTISGNKACGITQRHNKLHQSVTFTRGHEGQIAFCVSRLSYAGRIAVPGPDGEEGDHQQPRWLLHPPGLCSLGKWKNLWTVQRPAALLPFTSGNVPAVMHGWSNEPTPLSPGEGRALMGSSRWGVHQEVLPGKGVLERPHGPTHWPTQQTGSRKDLQAARYPHIFQR